MSYRRSSNEVEAWPSFCVARARTVERLPRLAAVLATADRFDRYLQTGDAEQGATLASLDETEWEALTTFVKDYSEEWQSWFVPSLYVAFYAEAERRSLHGADRTS